MKSLFIYPVLGLVMFVNTMYSQNNPNFRIKPETIVGMQLSQSLYGLGFTNYIAPRFSVDVSQKISAYVSAGAFSSSFRLADSNSKISTTGFYTQAGISAQINPKLAVYGDILYGNFGVHGTTNALPNLNFRQITVGAEYKVSNNFSVGVQVTQTEHSNSPIKNKYDY